MRKVSGLCELITRSNRACGLSAAAAAAAAQATLGRATQGKSVASRLQIRLCAIYQYRSSKSLFAWLNTHTHTHIQANIEGIA